MSNFPPGVTGGEYAIAGPDYERESGRYCRKCKDVEMFELGYHGDKWLECPQCHRQVDLAPLARDPDYNRWDI